MIRTIIVANALTSGVTPVLFIERIRTGNVDCLAPASILLMTTSSNDITSSIKSSFSVATGSSTLSKDIIFSSKSVSGTIFTASVLTLSSDMVSSLNSSSATSIPVVSTSFKDIVSCSIFIFSGSSFSGSSLISSNEILLSILSIKSVGSVSKGTSTSFNEIVSS